MELDLNFKQILHLINKLSLKQKEQIRTLLSEELESEPKNATSKKRRAGGLKGFVTHMSDDFDAPLEDIKPYME